MNNSGMLSHIIPGFFMWNTGCFGSFVYHFLERFSSFMTAERQRRSPCFGRIPPQSVRARPGATITPRRRKFSSLEFFRECTVAGSEHLCTQCSLTGSDITGLPLHYTSNGARVITQRTRSELKGEVKKLKAEFDLGETGWGGTVADASGPTRE